MGRPLALLALVSALAAACSDSPSESGGARSPEEAVAGAHPGSPTARRDLVETWRADLAAQRDPSDGGGRAWIEREEGEPSAVVAGSLARFRLLFEAGPLGVREGGAVTFQVSPFWGWSSPQLRDPERAGYTTVESLATGVELEPRLLGDAEPRPLVVTIRGRDLAAGERLRFVYGAGSVGAVVDSYAERASRFWFAVDGDGDGVRELVADPPSVEVLPAAPARLVASLSSSARPGERARLTLAVLDVACNAGCAVDGRVRLVSEPPGLALPDEFAFEAADGGRRTIELETEAEGIFRVRASLELGDERFESISNPLWVSAERGPVYWADLHGHSAVSDGTGTPADYYRYAREVAGLDAAALTDHDHFGMRALDADPETWERIEEAARAANEPGRFVALLGYEWTSWIYGHRHVVYFADAGGLYSSLDERYETPDLLWNALRGSGALTFAHHSAGGPIAIDWSFAPDVELEPCTEVTSAHGTSESEDGPSRIYAAARGNFVRDALALGYRLGFVASGDGHDGHPGLTHLAPIYGYRPPPPSAGPNGLPQLGNGGLAAIRADELTRPALRAALRARRTYATNGPRILVEAAWNGRRMGSTIPASELAEPTELAFRISGTAPIARLELVRDGIELASIEAGGSLDLADSLRLAPAAAGEFVYLRVEQEDGGLAWTSPFFVE